MAEDDSPAESLKRATSACLRAIAERGDVTVSFGSEPAGIAGTRSAAYATAEPAIRRTDQWR